MSTPISTNTPYCSPAEMRRWVDFRQLGDCLNDDGTRVTTVAEFDTHETVKKALMSASGRVESATLKGNRYSIPDLQNLNGGSKEMLSETVAMIAFWNLFRRRHQDAKIEPGVALAFDTLEQLAQGARILSLSEHAAADTPDNDFLTAAENERRNLASVQAARVFGRRSWRYQPGTSSSSSSND